MKIGIIVAMEKELAQLKSLLSDVSEERHGTKVFFRGKTGDNEIILQQCGIGKVNSAIGATELINNYAPEIVISSGVAGGADVILEVTDVVVGTECCYHDAYCGTECAMGQVLGMPASFKAPEWIVEKAKAVSCGTRIHAGLIVSGDWFVDSRDKMRTILSDFPNAMAVDMESCSIAQTCHIYGVPFISFRIISDIPLKDNKAQQYFDFWDKISNDSFMVTKTFLESL